MADLSPLFAAFASAVLTEAVLELRAADEQNPLKIGFDLGQVCRRRRELGAESCSRENDPLKKTAGAAKLFPRLDAERLAGRAARGAPFVWAPDMRRTRCER